MEVVSLQMCVLKNSKVIVGSDLYCFGSNVPVDVAGFIRVVVLFRV